MTLPAYQLTSPPTGALKRVDQAILQEPLVASRSSRPAVQLLKHIPPPRAVFVGIGLCTPRAMTRGLPFDVLGLLLPAERIRLALGASQLVLFVADTHARVNGFAPEVIRHRANVTVRTLLRIKLRLGFDAWSVVRASQISDSADYRQVLDEVRERSRADAGRPYMVRQVADVVHAQRGLGGIVKVGWILRPQRAVAGTGDEMAFDKMVQPWSGERVPFVYTKPGRTLDDRAKKAPPYVETNPARRILLDPREEVARKLDPSHGCGSTLAGVRKHLKAITRTYGRLSEPVRGTLEERTAHILTTLYGG